MVSESSSSELVDPVPGASADRKAETSAGGATQASTLKPGGGAGIVEIPKIDPNLLAACIHCGLCLPACPTYLATGRETESPRGRIYLMNLWQKGEQPLTPRLAEHIESCLGCFGCQTACPSGVQYDSILNQARPYLARLRPGRVRRLMRFVFSKILPDYPRLRFLGKALRMWQSSGGFKLLPKTRFVTKMTARLARWQEFLPPIPQFAPLPKQSWMSGEKRGQVQLFTGCVMDIFYNQVNHACVRLLTLQRQIVCVPDQTCCGALAHHAGENDIAEELARRNIEYFQDKPGSIVVTSAGCGAMLTEYGDVLDKDEDWREAARDFCERVVDVTEFLSDHEFAKAPRSLGGKVAYHAACHLHHAQHVRDEPSKLLSTIDGLEIVALQESEHCCGSAGIFNLTHTQLSLEVLARKIDFIKETGAEIVVTTNPGCLLQLEAGAREAGLPVRVLHLAQLLDEAYLSE